MQHVKCAATSIVGTLLHFYTLTNYHLEYELNTIVNTFALYRIRSIFFIKSSKQQRVNSNFSIVWVIYHLAFCIVFEWEYHYSDVMMRAMASQITGVPIVSSTVCSRRRSKKTSKLRVTGLSELTGECPQQKASNGENVTIWWRHHVLESTDSFMIYCNMTAWIFGAKRQAVACVTMENACQPPSWRQCRCDSLWLYLNQRLIPQKTISYMFILINDSI